MPDSYLTQEDLVKIRKLATMLAQSGHNSTFNGVRMDKAAAALRRAIPILDGYLNDEDEQGICPDNGQGDVRTTTSK